MDRQSSITGRTTRLLPAVVLRELLPALAALLIAVQCLTAIMLLARRFAGAISLNAAPGWLVAWVLAASILAAATRAVWFGLRPHGSRAIDLLVLYAPTVAILLTALSLSSAGMPLLLVSLAWLIAAGEESFTLWFVSSRSGRPRFDVWLPWRRQPGGLGPARDRSDTRVAEIDTLRPHDAASDDSLEAAASIGTEARPSRPVGLDRASQRIERVQLADGADRLVGTLMAYFAPDQITAHFHVAFCPPFAAVPRIDYRQTVGPAARIKVGQILPHGVRFDVKLAGPPTTATQLVLEVRAIIESGDASPHAR